VDDLSEDSSEEEEQEAIAQPAVKPVAKKQEQNVPKAGVQGKGDADSSSDEEEIVKEKKTKAIKNQKLKKELQKE
jgi:hypothetical protein